MATREFQRKLVVTADTSGLAKGAAEVQRFGQGVNSASDYLKQMKTTMDAASFREFAAGMQPAIAAEKEMARWTKQLAVDMKPVAAELRAQEVLHAKAASALQKRALSEARAAEALRKTYDSSYANALRYAGVEEQVQRQIQQRNLTLEEGNTILAGAAGRFKQMGAATGAANQNIKLTTGQVTNLGYQLNDVATMLALGASPFQIIASQAGQVTQALQDGPGGIKGSLAAIGTSIAGFASRIGPVGLAVGGVTAAAAGLWYMLSDSNETRSAQKALEDYEKLIDRLEGGFGGAAEAAKNFFKEATQGSAESAIADTRRSVVDLQRDLKAAIGDLGNDKSLDFQINPFRARGLSDTREQIRSLFLDLREGRKTASEFDQALALIELDPKAEKSMRDFAGQIRVADDNVQSLAAQLGAARAAAEELNKVNGRGSRVTTSPNEANPFDLRDRFGGGNPLADRLDPEGMDKLRQGLKDQADALTETTNKANEYTESVADQRQGMEDSIASLRLQTDMLGESDGAIAAAKMRMDALAEAQRQATDAGKGAIDPALVSFITQQAEEYGRLTDQVKANTGAQREQEKAASDVRRQQERVAEFASDLQFERSIAGLPEAEQRVRETIRGLDVEYDSFEGQRLAAGIRYNDSLVETQDRMKEMGEIGNEVFFNLIDAIGSGENAMGAFAKAFSGLGKQLASDGFDKLFGGLFGGGSAPSGGSSGGLAGALSAVAGAIKSPAPTPTARPSYAAVDVAAASGSIMTYAKRFNSSVDDRLLKILNTAASRFDLSVDAVSGLRPGDKRFHGQGVATDVQIYGQNGKALGNYQDPATFRTYEKFAQLSKQVQSELFPELEGMLRWGGYFAGAKGKYGAVDNMHFDLAGGKVGMGGGSWENGLTASQRKLWPGAESAGMSRQDFQRVLTKGTSQGVQDGVKATAYDMGGYDSGSSNGGMTRGQAGLGVLDAAAGIAAQGYQSGNPISGGISGALGGLGAAGSIASAFPAVAGIAGPLGMVGGAAIGIISSALGRKRSTQADVQRRYAEYTAKKGNDRDSDQCILAA